MTNVFKYIHSIQKLKLYLKDFNMMVGVKEIGQKGGRNVKVLYFVDKKT